jgi:hypothetical protein
VLLLLMLLLLLLKLLLLLLPKHLKPKTAGIHLINYSAPTINRRAYVLALWRCC